MKIVLKNEIDLNGEIELVHQTYPVEVMEKNGQLYLLYQNEEKEKVIIKCADEELTMTRYSSPKSVMRFTREDEAVVILPTPVGVQHFATKTHHYSLDQEAQKLQLRYDLKQLDGDAVFASYRMEISWGSDSK